MTQFVINAFYLFATLDDTEAMKEPLLAVCNEHGVKGTIILASEGINSTVAGSRKGVDALFAHLRSYAPLANLEGKESYSEFMPFHRMKVKLKDEIVTFRQEGVRPSDQVGTYVKPAEWNELISDPDVILIDTRNDFEYQIGTFEGAVNPETTSFVEFAEYVEQNLDPENNKKVAMFCTGGIRCERATSYLLKKGFEEVYHLKGGILKYMEQVPVTETMWNGECFVFDNRVTVNHNLEVGTYTLCHNCWHPLNRLDIETEQFEPSVSCPYCHDDLTEEKKVRLRQRRLQVELAQKRGELHIGRQETNAAQEGES